MGLINAAYDTADNIMTVKEARSKKDAAKKMAMKKVNQKNHNNFAIF